jgi:hypothetical protein
MIQAITHTPGWTAYVLISCGFLSHAALDSWIEGNRPWACINTILCGCCGYAGFERLGVI